VRLCAVISCATVFSAAQPDGGFDCRFYFSSVLSVFRHKSLLVST